MCIRDRRTGGAQQPGGFEMAVYLCEEVAFIAEEADAELVLSLIHISEPTRPYLISYAVFCFNKKKHNERARY